MGERTSYPPGTFCWTELSTSDAEGAKAFYGSLFGWESRDVPVGDEGTYVLMLLGGLQVSGVAQTDQAPPAWLSFVSVEDADSATARAAELGATVLMDPFDVEQHGRMSMITDPTGAVLALWQPGTHVGAGLVNDPGCLCLNQLNTSDPEEAQRFYGALFGWRFTPVGTEEQAYWGIGNPTDGGDALNGGMMPLPPGTPAPSHWLCYFTAGLTAGDLDAAVGHIREAGGTVLFGPMPIPSGRIAGATDPQGAAFALFEGRVDP
jgi:predicted enzyme related to lactoylglutathione lyase